ncbi:MAG: alanine racemase [Geovibrio sp.]|nr:alanine racemase [Geovibrio sp.]
MQKKIESLRPTYAQIDLNAFAHNIEQARSLSGTDIIAIIKAGRYGHGALPLAEYAWKRCGVKRFGVATLFEGIMLREHLGREPMIFLLGYVDQYLHDEMFSNNLIPAVFDDEIASAYHAYLAKHDRTADITLKIDTGMHRLGYQPDMDYYSFTVKYPRFRVCHVMSHLSSSDTDPEYSNYQKERFRTFITKNHIKSNTSLLNSSGIANIRNEFSLVRPGIMLYGYLYGNNEVALKKVMRIYSKVVHIKQIAGGETVSYNRRFTADRDMTIGVVPIGYADGYSRRFSNRAEMRVNGVNCPVIGTVCMDMTMIDLSNVPLNGSYPEVEVLGDNITADKWAELADTISYEVLCGISDRIPRIYKD